MNPEDQLDHMIEAMVQGRQPSMPTDPDLAEPLQVAEVFARLNAISVPPDLAERVLIRISEHVDRRTTRGIILPFPGAGVARRTSRLKVLVAVVASILVLIVATAGISSAAASALPGNPLYPIKQWQQNLALTQAQDAADRAGVAMQNVRNGLHDLRATVAQHAADTSILAALADVADQTRIAQAAVDDIPPGDTRDARAAELDTLIGQEKQTLHDLLSQVDWSVRAAFTRQLGALGDSVPSISGVQVAEQNDQITLTVTGQAFVAGSQIIVDGTLIPGTIVSQTSTQIVAQFDHSRLGGGHHTIGVVNPDGTVALWATSVEDDNGKGDDHGGSSPTPSATETSGGGDDHHGGTPTPSPTGGSDGGGHHGGNATPTPSSGGKDDTKTPTPTETHHH